MATASIVASSTMVRHFTTRPSAVRSNAKSADQKGRFPIGRTLEVRLGVEIHRDLGPGCGHAQPKRSRSR